MGSGKSHEMHKAAKSSLKNKVKSCKSLLVKIFEREMFIKALTTKHIYLKYFFRNHFRFQSYCLRIIDPETISRKHS